MHTLDYSFIKKEILSIQDYNERIKMLKLKSIEAIYTYENTQDSEKFIEKIEKLIIEEKDEIRNNRLIEKVSKIIFTPFYILILAFCIYLYYSDYHGNYELYGKVGQWYYFRIYVKIIVLPMFIYMPITMFSNSNSKNKKDIEDIKKKLLINLEDIKKRVKHNKMY